MRPANSELQRHALDYWQIARNRLGLIFFTFLLVFVAAALITYIMPRKFRGHLEMVIQRNDEDVRVEGHQQDMGNTFSDSYFKTQFESITKRKTLDRVIDRLDLQKRWIEAPTHINVGQWYQPSALRKNIDGMMVAPVPVFWSISKK